MSILRDITIYRLSVLVTLPKNFRTRVPGSVVIRLYAGECTPSVDGALKLLLKPSTQCASTRTASTRVLF